MCKWFLSPVCMYSLYVFIYMGQLCLLYCLQEVLHAEMSMVYIGFILLHGWAIPSQRVAWEKLLAREIIRSAGFLWLAVLSVYCCCCAFPRCSCVLRYHSGPLRPALNPWLSLFLTHRAEWRKSKRFQFTMCFRIPLLFGGGGQNALGGGHS